ncbi:beta-lactamase/transpeptidase-like protein [Linnemannia elongata AG-77]|uniref:Beta-lactamase/transpeptidase-like protein n=1 Tax=Linnemannia elongata AG-77 TaxID=1314771 RepID=A0A197JZL8_9FUNG|nr:beta-lactamase/transpeptidase-like protein [Linnemannia elongata AG-77]
MQIRAEPTSLKATTKTKDSLPADFSSILEDARIKNCIQGMGVAVLYKGELIFADGFGKRNDEDPFTKDTLMPIGSVTKSFTAIAIGELVAEGKMDWDTTPVNTYLPEFELKDPVLTSQLTLVDLLSHRTNLPNVFMRWFKSKESRIELIKYLRYADQPSKLTSTLNYSNTMYAVAGEAGARVAGVSYEELVKTKVFEPLGLTNSGFSQSALKQFSNYALPYDAASFEDAKKGNFIRGELDEDYLTDAPAGDIYSNVLDLVRYGRAVLKGGEVDGKQVLNKENVAEAWTGRTFSLATRRTPDFAPVQGYGLGWAIDAYKGHAKYSHNGLISGYRSSLDIYPDLDLVVAAQANVNKTVLTDNLSHYILDELLDLPRTQDWLFDVSPTKTERTYTMSEKALRGDFPEKIANRPPAHSLKEYAGEYTNLAQGDVSIVYEEREDALYFKQAAFFDSRMEHHHFELFTVVLRMSAFGSAVGVKFETGADGKVAAFTLVGPEYMDAVFKRKVAVPATAAKEE